MENLKKELSEKDELILQARYERERDKEKKSDLFFVSVTGVPSKPWLPNMPRSLTRYARTNLC